MTLQVSAESLKRLLQQMQRFVFPRSKYCAFLDELVTDSHHGNVKIVLHVTCLNGLQKELSFDTMKQASKISFKKRPLITLSGDWRGKGDWDKCTSMGGSVQCD